MLHMIVNTHNAESCAFRSDEDEAALSPGIDQLASAAAARDAAVQGFWVNSASHTFFILVDAPNAHVIDEVIREVQLTGRTHSQVVAVLDMADLKKAVEASAA